MSDENESEVEGIEEDVSGRLVGFDEDSSEVVIPETLPILPLRGVVLFPSAIVPLPISRKPSLELVEHCLAGDRILGLVSQKVAEQETPDPDELYLRGTAGRLLKMLKYPDKSVRILVQGLRRIEVD
jgi:ATP-dependent Lon protease